MTSDDRLGRRVMCPKCGANRSPPRPRCTSWPPRCPRGVHAGFLGLRRRRRPGAGRNTSQARPGHVADRPGDCGRCRVVAWPALNAGGIRSRPTRPRPPPPSICRHSSTVTSSRPSPGTIDEPPAIRSFRDVRRVPDRDRKSRGRSPRSPRCTRSTRSSNTIPRAAGSSVRDPLGPAAETLDALHDAKAKADRTRSTRRWPAATRTTSSTRPKGWGGALAKMAEGVLAPRSSCRPMSSSSTTRSRRSPRTRRALALDYAAHRETWDALLKRPFPTLKADGPFLFDRAEVVATARDRLASLGRSSHEPPPDPRPLPARRDRHRLAGGVGRVAGRRGRNQDRHPRRCHPRPNPNPPGTLPASLPLDAVGRLRILILDLTVEDGPGAASRAPS